MNPEVVDRSQEIYQQKLDSILQVSLTPDNLHTFAEDALEELVNLSDTVRSAYKSTSTRKPRDSKAEELAAFDYYGLTDLDTVLDHVITLTDDIQRIEQFADSIARGSEAVLLPKNESMDINAKDGSFKKKETVPRLATTLFILEKDFNISINDPGQLHVTSGLVRPNMVRRTPYVGLEIPVLQRMVLVCDESANATFVLDTKELKAVDTSALDIMAQTKSELDEFLAAHPHAGKRLRYTRNFVPILKNLLVEQIDGTPVKFNREETSSYLRSRPAEGMLTLKGISRAVGKSQGLIQRTYDELQDEISDREYYVVGGKPRMHLGLVGQAIILNNLDEKGHFRPKASDDRSTFRELTHDWPISEKIIEEHWESLVEEGVIGEVDVYLDEYGKPKRYPTDSQIETLRVSLENEKLFTSKAGDGDWSKESLARELGISPQSINKSIHELGDEFGEMVEKRFGAVLTPSGNADQRKQLIQYLEKTGRFYPLAEEGMLSIKRSAPEVNMSDVTLQKVVGMMREEGLLGPKRMRRFGGRNGAGEALSQAERERIIEYAVQAVRRYIPPNSK